MGNNIWKKIRKKVEIFLNGSNHHRNDKLQSCNSIKWIVTKNLHENHSCTSITWRVKSNLSFSEKLNFFVERITNSYLTRSCNKWTQIPVFSVSFMTLLYRQFEDLEIYSKLILVDFLSEWFSRHREYFHHYVITKIDNSTIRVKLPKGKIKYKVNQTQWKGGFKKVLQFSSTAG